MQKACQGHNASLIAIKSENSFEEARALSKCSANAVAINDTQIREILPPKAVYKAQETRRFDEG
ncbi:hypothetical protein TCAL_15911, partial [Tigriopus californicus]